MRSCAVQNDESFLEMVPVLLLGLRSTGPPFFVCVYVLSICVPVFVYFSLEINNYKFYKLSLCA